MSKITIQYFSDVLCIWAYISEVRVQELETNFTEQIDLDFRTLSIFGNVPGKIKTAWAAKGGIEGYANHVHEVANRFDHITLHPKVWVDATPTSSLPSHLYVSAIKIAEEQSLVAPKTHEKILSQIRTAFFVEAQDISDATVLQSILAQAELPVSEIEALVTAGQAYAKLAEDMQLAKEQDIRSSPTWLFNEGRQRLTGNVGYRIIEANIRELLERPSVQHSWC